MCNIIYENECIWRTAFSDRAHPNEYVIRLLSVFPIFYCGAFESKNIFYTLHWQAPRSHKRSHQQPAVPALNKYKWKPLGLPSSLQASSSWTPRTVLESRRNKIIHQSIEPHYRLTYLDISHVVDYSFEQRFFERVVYC